MAMEGTGVSMSRNSKLMTYTSSKSASISNTQKADIQTDTAKIKDDEIGNQTELRIKNTNKALKEAVEKINENMKDTRCEYGIDDETNRVTIKIVDKKTKEILREYPPEETLDIIAKVWELAGINVDRKL